MKVTIEELEKAIVESKGIVAAVCKRLNISRWAFYKRLKNHQELIQVIHQAREELADLAELKLWEKLKEGDIRAILFTLKTIGKSRGFVETIEIEETSKIINIIEVPELSAYEPTIDDIQEKH